MVRHPKKHSKGSRVFDRDARLWIPRAGGADPETRSRIFHWRSRGCDLFRVLTMVPLFSCSGKRFGPEVTRCAGHNASGGSGSLLRQTPYNQCPSARASLSRLPVPPTTPPMSKRYQPFSVNRRRVRDDRLGQPRGSVTFLPRKSFPPLGSQEADRRQPRLPCPPTVPGFLAPIIPIIQATAPASIRRGLAWGVRSVA